MNARVLFKKNKNKKQKKKENKNKFKQQTRKTGSSWGSP